MIRVRRGARAAGPYVIVDELGGPGGQYGKSSFGAVMKDYTTC